jgi:hypothetical protein
MITGELLAIPTAAHVTPFEQETADSESVPEGAVWAIQLDPSVVSMI